MESQKLLFTPGPLTTSRTVKQAMLELGRVADGAYEAVLMQGSGTFAIESVISSVIPRDGKLLVLINGAYGRRMAKIAAIHEIATAVVESPEAVRNPGKYSDARVGRPILAWGPLWGRLFRRLDPLESGSAG